MPYELVSRNTIDVLTNYLAECFQGRDIKDLLTTIIAEENIQNLNQHLRTLFSVIATKENSLESANKVFDILHRDDYAINKTIRTPGIMRAIFPTREDAGKILSDHFSKSLWHSQLLIASGHLNTFDDLQFVLQKMDEKFESMQESVPPDEETQLLSLKSLRIQSLLNALTYDANGEKHNSIQLENITAEILGGILPYLPVSKITIGKATLHSDLSLFLSLLGSEKLNNALNPFPESLNTITQHLTAQQSVVFFEHVFNTQAFKSFVQKNNNSAAVSLELIVHALKNNENALSGLLNVTKRLLPELKLKVIRSDPLASPVAQHRFLPEEASALPASPVAQHRFLPERETSNPISGLFIEKCPNALSKTLQKKDEPPPDLSPKPR